MKSAISCSAAAALLAGALAAPCIAHAQTDDWTGPYLGVTGVYAFTNGAIINDYDQDGLLIYSSQRHFEQAFGGVRAGYNLRLPAISCWAWRATCCSLTAKTRPLLRLRTGFPRPLPTVTP